MDVSCVHDVSCSKNDSFWFLLKVFRFSLFLLELSAAWGAKKIAEEAHSLFLKVFTQGAEPMVFKGGTIVPIHKRASQSVADNYRGVVLLPVLSKALHAILRSRIVAALRPEKPVGLLGGFPHQRVTFGNHAIQTFGELAALHGISSGILFIDLKHAYHHVVRSLCLGNLSDDSDLQASLDRLPDDFMKQGCAQAAFDCTPLETLLGHSPLLGLLLEEVHTDTFILLQDKWIRTARGSRPGSPLADMIFAGLLVKLHRLFDDLLMNESNIATASATMGTRAYTLTWADDVAIELATLEPSLLVPTLQKLAGAVCELFAQHGFTVNLKPGKTSAVLSFRGKGAPDLRRKYLVEERQCELTIGNTTVGLPLLCQYTHLGVKTTAAAHLEHEVRQRIGQALSAFHPIRRSLIGNKNLSQTTRCRLVESLLLSKLFFGCGAWSSLPASLLRKIEHTMTIFYREALDQQFWRGSRCSDEVLYSKYKLLPAKARISRDRLIYASSLARDGPGFLRERLQLIHQGRPDESWLAYLERDMAWLHSLIPNVHDADWNANWATRWAFWSAEQKAWHRMVTHACKVYKAQEHNMYVVRQWHQQIFDSLMSRGAKIPAWTDADASLTEQLKNFKCHCGKSFETKRGLAVHQLKVHQTHAPEFKYASGTTCPACLKCFWSTKRLRQHLSYMPRSGAPNDCFSKLQLTTPDPEGPEVSKTDASLRGTNRLDAISVPGPRVLQMYWADSQRLALLRDLATLDQAFLQQGCPFKQIVPLVARYVGSWLRVLMSGFQIGSRTIPTARQQLNCRRDG